MTLTLDQLKVGQVGIVTKLNSTGEVRRRMMDLGILPGTELRAEFSSPLGDPVAFRVREALIALRKGQAKQIELRLLEEDKS